MESIVHEYEHHLGTTGGSSIYDGFSSGFDEGSTELLANRYAWMAFQIDPKVKKELEGVNSYTYAKHVNVVANTALIVNDYDEDKAIAWIKEIRRANPDKRKKMVKEAEKLLEKKGFIAKGATEVKEKKEYLRRDRHWIKKDKKKLREEMKHYQQELGYLPKGVIDPSSLRVNDNMLLLRADELDSKSYQQLKEKAWAYTILVDRYDSLNEIDRKNKHEFNKLELKDTYSPFNYDYNDKPEIYAEYLASTDKDVIKANHIDGSWWVDV
ncbi:MAG: hypothetical protein ACTSPB_24960 [Candidatus Thorarchaeota archaeon]